MLRIVEVPNLANEGEDHGYMNKEHYLHWYKTFWRNQKQNILDLNQRPHP